MQSQTDLIKGRITAQLAISPTQINEAIDHLVKGAATVMYTAVLLRSEVKELQAANVMKMQRKKRRKKRIQEAGVLSVQEGQNIIQNTAVEEQIRMEMQRPQGVQRRCGRCKGVGHNTHTCIRHQESNVE